MFHQDRGVRMCHYKKIREELGTINYNQTSVQIPNPKINLVEVYATEKKERKRKERSKAKVKKTISIDEKKNKMDKILELVNLPENDSKLEIIEMEEQKEKDLEQHDETQEGIEEYKEKAREEEHFNEIKEDVENNNANNDANNGSDNDQDGGKIDSDRKRIYVTNLTVEKDKEMFQM